MNTLSDKQVMDNTSIIPQEDGTVLLKMTLPDNSFFEQRAESADSARKYFIPFCDSVRAFWSNKQAADLDRKAAERDARKRGDPVRPPEKPQDETSPPTPTDTKGLVISHFHGLQEQIDKLGEDIETAKDIRAELRDERDSLHPVMVAWGITE